MYLFFKTSQSKFVHLLGSTWGEEVQECKQMDVISLNEWTNKEEKRLQEEEWRLQVGRKNKKEEDGSPPLLACRPVPSTKACVRPMPCARTPHHPLYLH
jgi:hypothetical protein